MPTLVIETFIAAPRELCFDLAREVEAHCATAAFTGEQAVAPGKTSGLLELGDTVTFRGRHLGVVQRLTARITELRRPERFVDEQVRGAFARLVHIHEFDLQPGGTLMRDILTWTSPLGALGRLADRLFVRPHLAWFVTRKQAALKALAEECAAAQSPR